MTAEPCCNCPGAGAVLVNDPGANPLVYCSECLPVHLIERLKAGQLAPAPDIDE